MTLFDSKCIAHPQGKRLISPSSCVAIAIVCTLIHCGGLPSRESAGFDRCLQGCTKLKSRGLSSKNRFILYRGFPLWLGSTGEGCDSIQVSRCTGALNNLASSTSFHFDSRFYSALVLWALLHEMPAPLLLKKFALSKGQLQQLQQSAASYTHTVGVFRPEKRDFDKLLIRCKDTISIHGVRTIY